VRAFHGEGAQSLVRKYHQGAGAAARSAPLVRVHRGEIVALDAVVKSIHVAGDGILV